MFCAEQVKRIRSQIKSWISWWSVSKLYGTFQRRSSDEDRYRISNQVSFRSSISHLKNYSNSSSIQKENRERLNVELNNLERQRREKAQNLKGCEQVIGRHQKESYNLRINLQNAERALEALQDALERDAIEEGRLDALKEHLTEAKEEKTTHEASYGDAVLELDKVKDSLRSTKEQMSALDLQIAEVKAKISKAEAKVSIASATRTTALYSKNSAIDKVAELRQSKINEEKHREVQENTVTEFISQASSISTRVAVPEGETADHLEKRLEKLSSDLKKYEKQYDI